MNLDLFELNEEEKKKRQSLSPYNIEFFTSRFLPHGDLVFHNLESSQLPRLHDSRNRFSTAHHRIMQASIVHYHAVSAYVYFMNRSNGKDDVNLYKAQILGWTYIDYVPHLLYTVDEILADGLVKLFDGIFDSNRRKKLKNLKEFFESQYPKMSFTKSLIQHYDSLACKELIKYRDDWVHNRHIRVDSKFYEPPDWNEKVFPDGGWTLALFDTTKVKAEYTFESLASRLNEVIYITAQFADACFDEWEKDYSANKLK